MGNVEAIESRPDVGAELDVRRPVAPTGQWAAVALSLIAAVLAVIAPSHAVFSASFSEVPGDREQVVNGWGDTAPSSLLAVHHGANFGVLMMICAGVLLIPPALLVLGRQHPRVRFDLRLVLCAIVAPALLTGVVAGLIVYEGGYGSQVEDLSEVRGRGTASVYWGSCLWLSVAAAACAIVAAVVIVRSEVARVARSSE